MYTTKKAEKNDDVIVIEQPKQRAKQLNDVLRSRKGGRMRSEKDHNRQREKQEARRASYED